MVLVLGHYSVKLAWK